MVGSAIVRQLLALGHAPQQLITRTHAELDLTDQAAVRAFLAAARPDQVYLAAAKVGGIHANNTYPAEFIYDNLMVEPTSFMNPSVPACASCSWAPAASTQASRAAQDALLTARSSHQQAYAIGVAGISSAAATASAAPPQGGLPQHMPTNLYGPGDKYHHRTATSCRTDPPLPRPRPAARSVTL
jgi:GDP-L-fucose synthase